jgi:general transcriptional corepressor CYC8
LGNLEDAIQAYEHALRHNSQSIPAMNAISLILRTREEFAKAVEFLQRIIKLDERNGEAWGSLGECRPTRYCSVSKLTRRFSTQDIAI